MNYLIFGGDGFIGRHLENFINKNESNSEIYILDILNTRQSANFIYTDVRKEINLEIKLDYSQTTLYNLAAIHTTPGHPDFDYFETNILGARNICDFAERHGIKNIGFTSSIAPYGASEDIKYEESLPTPNTPYGISKLVAEEIHKAWYNSSNDRTLLIVRPGVVFGQDEGGNYTRLYKSLAKGQFFYPGRKDTIKSCIYVKDVVRVLYTYFLSPDDFGNFELFNLAIYPSPQLHEIVDNIAKVIDKNPPRLVVPFWLLSYTAKFVYNFGLIFGRNINGIHPDRVKKLNMSTNISGLKLHESNFTNQYSLEEALNDWFKNTNRTGLF